jgi:hypothetical protein
VASSALLDASFGFPNMETERRSHAWWPLIRFACSTQNPTVTSDGSENDGVGGAVGSEGAYESVRDGGTVGGAVQVVGKDDEGVPPKRRRDSLAAASGGGGGGGGGRPAARHVWLGFRKP